RMRDNSARVNLGRSLGLSRLTCHQAPPPPPYIMLGSSLPTGYPNTPPGSRALAPELYSWSMPNSLIGQRVPRVESAAKVTGSALYSADVSLPGMVWGK